MRSAYLVVIALGTLVAGVRAQVPQVEYEPDVPASLRRIVETAGDRTDAWIFAGDTTLERDARHVGTWVQLGGRLVVAGTVTGDVVAVDAELQIRPGAAIGGDMTLIGGRYLGTTMATFQGRRRWLRDEPIGLRRDATAGVLVVTYDPPVLGFPFEPKGIAGIVIHEYTGVDGLLFGLAAGLKELPDQPETVLAGGPIFRTARDDVGWDVVASRLFRRASVTLGGRAYRITDTPERWHRGDFSNSLASLFLADDDRTYFERTGYGLWAERPVRLASTQPPVTLRASWRDDDFDGLESERPLAFFAEDDDWRTNPPIEPGRGRALGVSVEWDRRDDPSFPRRGVWLQGRFDHWGFGGEFGFDFGRVDARGYVPLPTSAGSFVSLRGVAGGRLGGGDTLAPQFWFRLGGGSSIPGYDALEPLLTGDRTAFATVTLHQAVGGPLRGFERIYLVGLGSVGDAWFEADGFDANASFGAGIAGNARLTYAGGFVAYGVQTDDWQLYFRLKPWF